MRRYRALKERLTHDFPNDAELQRRVAAAASFDEIAAALGASYEAAVVATAETARDGSPETAACLASAERAVAAREEALLELLDFFDRERAVTPWLEVRRTGPEHVRVHRRTAAPSDRAA